MSSLLQRIAAGVAPPPPSLTTAEFERQCESGAYPPDWNVELLDGTLVLRDCRDDSGEITAVGPQHSYFTTRVRVLLDPLARAAGCHLREEKPTAIPPRNGPRPDGAIVRGDESGYFDRNPGAGDILLTIEVAHSSLEHDRTTKLRTYAEAGLSPYWILNVAARELEVRTDPDPAAGTYRTLATLTAADAATLPLPGGGVDLPLADLLG